MSMGNVDIPVHSVLTTHIKTLIPKGKKGKKNIFT